MRNDFESVQSADGPSARLKNRLVSLGARAAMLSGSGAGVFGIFNSVREAKAAKEEIENH